MIPVESTFQVRPSMYNWTQEADPDRLDLRGLRARFNVVSIKADRQALQTIHDTYFDMVQSELNTVSIAVASIVFIPIIDSYITASTVNGGDSMPVDAAQAPYIWAQETLLWSDAAEDANTTDFLSAFNAKITWQLSSQGGVASPFLYLNYAGDTQDVFAGDPAENVERLKSVRGKYDPDLAFTNLMPGGWKVESA